MNTKNLVEFLGLIGKLKQNTRHIWSENNRQESVAEHCWRLSVMALLIADEFPAVDINKVVKMCLIHDFGEALTGDIPSFYKTKQHEEAEDLAINDLLNRLPDDLSKEFSELFLEMSAMKTEEAKLFKALDNLEAIISHNESPLETWIDLEYSENLTYGTDNTAYSEYLSILRAELKQDSINKIKEGEQTWTLQK